MTAPSRPLAKLLAATLLSALSAASLAGCASNGNNMGDYVPQWAGGLPADAPPRPGTARYDEFMQERERRRQMPAAERDKETQSNAAAAAAPSEPAAVAPAPKPERRKPKKAGVTP
jgi:hypothetical protein